MSSAARDIALNAPGIERAARAWMVFNISSAALVYVPLLPPGFFGP
jgi:hypothetical protein